jgi:uncharacterized protein
MWIERYAQARLLRAAATRPAVVLTGARQTGKTATLRRLFPRHRFVSLDLPSVAELAERQPDHFLETHPAPVILDEVQYAPGLFRHLKAAIDSDRARRGAFLLTGSQKFTLMAGIADSLAGRVEVVELETLSWREIQESRLDAGPVDHALIRGGFPELQANADIDAVAFYNSYLATYLERDVRALTNVGSLRDFERFLRACALRSAGLLNKADLARDVGIAPSTANAWRAVLEASGQIVMLEPWFSNRTTALVKTPKLYLADTGLLCALLNITTADELRRSPSVGAVWETFVFAQLRHREHRAGRGRTLFFWRSRTKEVDFVVDTGGRLELFEAKWTEVPGPADAAGLIAAREAMGNDVVSSASVVCRAPNGYPLKNGTRVRTISEI